MSHIRFQHNIAQGGIEVQFNLDYDGQKTIVSAITIHANFPNTLPKHPILENIQGEWLLTSTHKELQGDKVIEKYEYHTDPLSKELSLLILQHKEGQTPNFS